MLSEVITRARRRLLWNALAFHFAIAVTVVLAVLSLLLFLGTDILDWRWLIIVPAAPFAAGAWIAFRRLPASYPTAQLLDRRLNLADSLSTALFFTVPNPSRRCDDGARQAWRTLRIAGVDLRDPSDPFRATYLAVLPAIVAAGLVDLPTLPVRCAPDLHWPT
jgi:MFS family permease